MSEAAPTPPAAAAAPAPPAAPGAPVASAAPAASTVTRAVSRSSRFTWRAEYGCAVDEAKNAGAIAQGITSKTIQATRKAQQIQSKLRDGKRKAPKKIAIIDPKYKSTIIPKLINSIMYDGKKTIAEKITF